MVTPRFDLLVCNLDLDAALRCLAPCRAACRACGAI